MYERVEREGVYMEWVKCVCMGRGWVCAYGRVECAYMGRGRVCIWKGLSVHAWTRRGMMHVYGRGGVCVHANSAPNYLTLSFLCRFVSGSQDYAYPNFRDHNMNFARQHQLTY